MLNNPLIKPRESSMSRRRSEFTSALANAMRELTQDYGLSQETAVGALMNAIAPSATFNDEQVFSAMKNYNLGSDQALHALTVQAALEQIMTEQSISLDDALAVMTQRIANAKPQHHEQQEQVAVSRNCGSSRAVRIVPLLKPPQCDVQQRPSSLRRPSSVPATVTTTTPSRRRADSVAAAEQVATKLAATTTTDAVELNAASNTMEIGSNKPKGVLNARKRRAESDTSANKRSRPPLA